MNRMGRSAAAAISLTLLLAACGGGGDPGGTGAPGAPGTDAAGPDASVPAVATPAPDPATAPDAGSTPTPSPTPATRPDPRPARVAELDLSGVRVRAGWSHLGLFGPDLGSWEERFDELPDLIAPRATPGVPAGAYAERTELVRDPAPCFAFERRVLGVGVDVPGAAGRAIERALMAEVARWDGSVAEAAAARAADGTSWCEQGLDGRRVGFQTVEVHPEACALPSAGRAIVCHTVGRFAYLLGTRDTWTATHLVHDAATGARLRTADLLPRVDAGLLRVLADRIVAEVPRAADLPQDVDLPLDLVDADPLPSVEGMRWRWSPLSNLAGAVELLVPWDVLAALEGPDWDAVDLGALTWATDCTRDLTPGRVTLEAMSDEGYVPPRRPLWVEGGRMVERRHHPYSRSFTVDLSRVVRADVDGDGRAEAVVSAYCWLGNGFVDTLEVWAMRSDGTPTQLPPALTVTKTDGYVTDLAAGDGALVVTMRVGAVGDDWPHLNGYPRIRILELRLVDGVWVERVLSERDADDA